MRNVAFFLTPKYELAHINGEATLRQAIEKFETHGNFLEMIILDGEGAFVGILSPLDILLAFKRHPELTYENSFQIRLKELDFERNIQSVNINTGSDVLVEISRKQNIIPVIDGENRFIGIVRRAKLLEYYYQLALENANE